MINSVSVPDLNSCLCFNSFLSSWKLYISPLNTIQTVPDSLDIGCFPLSDKSRMLSLLCPKDIQESLKVPEASGPLCSIFFRAFFIRFGSRQLKPIIPHIFMNKKIDI